MNKSIVYRISFFGTLMFLLWFVYCAPVPPIQSARITSKLSSGVRYHYNDFSRKVQFGIEEPIKCNQNDYYGSQIAPDFEWFYSWSIKKRIEISGPLFFSSSVALLWGLNCKVFLFEVGQPKLFRNFCTSIFVGTNGSYTEENIYNYWGGLVLGTYGKVKNGELELVFQPSGMYTHHRARWWWGEFDISQTDFGTGSMLLNRKSIDLGLGAIYKPWKDQKVEFVGGFTYKHYFDKDFYPTNPHVRLLEFEESPYFFHLGIVINVIK